MLIKQKDDTFVTGPRDVLCILHDVEKKRFHAVFFEEKPFPGDRDIKGGVRLKSKMHNAKGSETIEDEPIELDKLHKKIIVPEANVWRGPVEWDGHPALMLLFPDWTKEAV
jgi:hypothetical protein